MLPFNRTNWVYAITFRIISIWYDEVISYQIQLFVPIDFFQFDTARFINSQCVYVVLII